MIVLTTKLVTALTACADQFARTKLVQRLLNVLESNTNPRAAADQVPAVIHTLSAPHIVMSNQSLNAWPTLIVRRNWPALIADAQTHVNRPTFVHVTKLALLSIHTHCAQLCAAVLQTLWLTVMVNVALSLCKKSVVPTMSVPTLINACEVFVFWPVVSINAALMLSVCRKATEVFAHVHHVTKVAHTKNVSRSCTENQSMVAHRLNVCMTTTVHSINPVWTDDASILAARLTRVVLVHFAMPKITNLFANVHKDTREIHKSDVLLVRISKHLKLSPVQQ
jgi:hypothetical protein